METLTGQKNNEHSYLNARFNIIQIFWIVLMTFISPICLGEEAAQVDKLKAAYLFNFAKFTEWPKEAFPSEDDKLVFCALEKEALNGALASLQGRSVKNRVIEVVVLNKVTRLSLSQTCHVLYVSTHMQKIDLSTLSVLSVGEDENIVESSYVINFRLINNKVRFDINLKQAKKKNIIISSYLLKLAHDIED